MSAPASDYVVLLHGMGRTRRSMQKLADRVVAAGHEPVNIGYPARRLSIERLARDVVGPAIRAGLPDTTRRVHFVTHSLGGILTRLFLADELGAAAHGTTAETQPAGVPEPLRLTSGHPVGRVVMLAPPNRGSEVADFLRPLGLYQLVTGPPGQQLGTNKESVPSRLNELGLVRYPVGVIAGTKTLNPLFSARLPGPNDGKVSVESTRLAGMHDFLAVDRSHTFIMIADDVIAQVLHFLAHGRFHRAQ